MMVKLAAVTPRFAVAAAPVPLPPVNVTPVDEALTMPLGSEMNASEPPTEVSVDSVTWSC